jgi:transposase
MVLMDKGSCHTARSLVRPANRVGLFSPPSSPELHPIERLWHEVKAPLAWVRAAARDALAHHGERIITQYSQAAIQTLTVRSILCASSSGFIFREK